MEVIKKNISTTIYCHFSFKRPNKGADGVGLFAVAFYRDSEGRKLICNVTKKLPLWENHQFITAIQSYENALRIISDMQGAMMNNGIKTVILITDNSTLAGWILDPKKNKAYTSYMNRAVEKYRAGAPRQIMVDIELGEVRQYEKSYKYCSEKYISENIIESSTTVSDEGKRKVDIENVRGGYKTISQMLNISNSAPRISGIREL